MAISVALKGTISCVHAQPSSRQSRLASKPRAHYGCVRFYLVLVARPHILVACAAVVSHSAKHSRVFRWHAGLLRTLACDRATHPKRSARYRLVSAVSHLSYLSHGPS